MSAQVSQAPLPLTALPDAAQSPATASVAAPAVDPFHTAPGAEQLHRIQLWDLPLRVFHWSLLAAVGTAIVTGKLGGEWMPLHGKAGIAIIGLLSFRLAWGLVGSTTSRFAHFLPSPRRVIQYLRGRWRGIGHNPLGALSVIGLIGLLGWQAGSGLFSNDDIAFAGPLASLLDDEQVQWLTGWHRVSVNGLFVLLSLHVAAIAFHVKIKKDNIVKPMLTGDKAVAADLPAPRPARRIALLAAVLVGLGAIYVSSGAWMRPEATVEAGPPGTTQASPTATATATGPSSGNATVNAHIKAAPSW
ncbi:MAG: cytochrome b/b6 domain-containing protein [Aquabacterium sp.]